MESIELEMRSETNVSQEINGSSSFVKLDTNKQRSEIDQRIIGAYIKLQSKEVNSIEEAEKMLKEAYEILSSKEQLNEVYLNKNSFDKLKRICNHNILNLNFIIGKIYIVFFDKDKIFEDKDFSENLLISLINELLKLNDNFKNTSLSERYERHLIIFFEKILTKYKFPDEQKEVITEIIDEYKKKESKGKNIIEVPEFEVFISILLDKIATLPSLEAQFNLFIDNKATFIKLLKQSDIKDTSLYEHYIDCGKILATLLYNDNYFIYFNEEKNNNIITNRYFYDNEEINSLNFLYDEEYSVCDNEKVKEKKEALIELIVEYLEHFSKIENTIQIHYIAYLILKRIYAQYYINTNEETLSNSKKIIKERIDKLLSDSLIELCSFNKDQIEECRQLLDHFLQSKIQTTQNIRSLLMKKIDELKSNDLYDFNFIHDPSFSFQYENININELDLKIGFPQIVEIPAGEVNNIYVEFETKCNFFTFFFLPKNEDVTCTITDITTKKHKKVVEFEKRTIFEGIAKVTIYSNNPVIYKICLDNSYSWITPKKVKFKIDAFSPINPFNIIQKLTLMKLKNEISQIDNIVTLSNHLTKIILYKLRKKNKTFNCGNVLNNITKLHQLGKKNLLTIKSLYIDKKKGLIYEEEFKNECALSKENFDKIFGEFILKSRAIEIKIINLFYINSEKKKELKKLDVFDVLGFYPSNFSIDDNVIFFCSYFSESCLLYDLYLKGLNVEKIETLAHLVFSPSETQVSIYYDGKIKLIKEVIEIPKSEENIEQFRDKVLNIFKEYSDSKCNCLISTYDNQNILLNKIIEELSNKVKDDNIKLSFNKTDEEFILQVLNSAEVFYLDD